MKNGDYLKPKIEAAAREAGISLVGYANVERWSQFQDVEPAFFPQTIWPGSHTVIVLGSQIFLPVYKTTPSSINMELYNTSNRVLDNTAYKISCLLSQEGFATVFFPRDCYGDIDVLEKNPAAAFSHVIAGKYAGLGTIGESHMLLTPEFGPRVRLVSVITSAELEPSPMQEAELCLRCGACIRNCPSGCLQKNDGGFPAHMDKPRCTRYHMQLKREFRFPCGVCAAVCPVGRDRLIYRQMDVSEQGIAHCRQYGSSEHIHP